MPYGRITPKQQEILDYIKNEILNRGFPPAVRSQPEIYFFRSFTSGSTGEKWIYPQRCNETTCD